MLSTALKYRLVALDLDGTLITDDLLISAEAQAAIAAAIERGVIVTLATGRMYRSALPFAQTLKLAAPLICYQGAMVRHSVTGETLYHQTVPLELARAFIQAAQDRNYHVNAYVDDVLYVEKVTPEAQFYSQLGRVEANPVGPLLDFVNSEAHRPTKLVVVTQEAETLALLHQLEARFSPDLYVTRSHPRLTEAINPVCNKGAALQALAEQLGLQREEVMAIGDNLNDLPMLQYAGLGVAVANASVATKEAAAYVTKAAIAAGVVEAIQKFVL
jgi:Cof subfamily protein (haloacid dehalogenase superfamily)